MDNLPCSLRTTDGEANYAEAKTFNKLLPLNEEVAIMVWDNWKLVENRFPYNMAFKTHNLLIPIRSVAVKRELTKLELDELDVIINTYVEGKYDMVFENTMRRRSIPGLFHIHVATYYDKRSEMKL